MPDKKLYDSFHISALIVKELNDQLTSAEEIELQTWLNSSESNRMVFEKVANECLRNNDLQQLISFNTTEGLKRVQQRIATSQLIELRSRKNYLLKAAAAVIIVLSATLWLYHKPPQHLTPVIVDRQEKIVPGGNKAILTLSNGVSINLQAAKNGTIANQGRIEINKTKDGQINYQTRETETSQPSPDQYNTLSVPNGGQYQLTLPDGSVVWLNAGSTLKYPVSFKYTERRVELSGEAYFEVSHNAGAPFRVVSNGQTVEVLGTHFNITSYPDDQGTITSLFQGSVKVSSGLASSILKPGQKAIDDRKSKALNILPVSEDEVLAWKNGYFNFNNDDIRNIMKSISRWYDVEVEFQGDIQGQSYWGTFPRSQNLTTLLKNLEQTKTIHFKVTGRRIIVMP